MLNKWRFANRKNYYYLEKLILNNYWFAFGLVNLVPIIKHWFWYAYAWKNMKIYTPSYPVISSGFCHIGTESTLFNMGQQVQQVSRNCALQVLASPSSSWSKTSHAKKTTTISSTVVNRTTTRGRRTSNVEVVVEHVNILIIVEMPDKESQQVPQADALQTVLPIA